MYVRVKKYNYYSMIFKTLLKNNSHSIKLVVVACIQSILTIFILLSNLYTYAEGTKELMPTPTDFGFIQINDRGREFATYNAPEFNRLYIHICTEGEIIYYGFKQIDDDISFRIKDPAGNIVVASQALPTSGQGYIATFNQAISGPSQLVGAAGYNAMNYTSLVAGDYYIEFANPGNTQRIFDYFDITVANGTISKSGRIWSYSWDINTKANGNPFTAKMYILSTDNIVTSIDFNGMQPFGAVIEANSTGLSNSGNLITDRKSKVGNFSAPEYKIFLNDPDQDCFPTGSFGNIVGQPVVTGCNPANRCINITVTKAGKVEIVLDLNETTGYQNNTKDLLIISEVVDGQNCIPWDSKDGQGNLVTAITGIPLEINYLNGVTHLPLYDVEDNPNGYIVELVRPAGSKPNLYWDDSAINKGTALDGKVNVTGCSNASGCHKWNDRGDNSSAETINTWWYPNIITKNLIVDIPLATVDADNRNPVGALNDSLVCEQISSFKLSGTIEGTTLGGSWTGGTGTFSPSRNVENPTYIPSLTERTAGFVKLFLSSITNGVCPTAKDSVKIVFERTPIVQVDIDRTICSTTTIIDVSALLTHANTGIWTGGNGTFLSPTNNATKYTPSPSDLAAGIINLIFTSTGKRLCKQADDTIIFTFEKPPKVLLPPNKSICVSSMSLPVAATLTNATTGIWSGGKGTFALPTNNSTTYTISPADITAGNIDLIFTSTGVRACPQEDDTINFNLNLRANIEVGPAISICEGVTTVDISATGVNASTLIWTGGNGSFLPNDALKTTYTLNPNEIHASQIELTLNGKNGICPDSSDVLIINIIPLHSVKVGKDTLICKSTDFLLTGSSVSNTTFKWYAIPSQTTLSLQPNALLKNVQSSGDYVLEATTANNCTNTDTISINVYDLPSLNPGGPYCLTSGLILEANATNVPNVTSLYNWKKGNTILQSDPINANFAIEDAGEFTLSYTTAGCSKDVVVIVNPKPVLITPDTLTACEGSSIELYTKSSTPVTLTWFDSNKNFIVSAPTTRVIPSNTVLLYYVEAKNATGCSNNDSIVTFSTIKPNISIQPAEICADSTAKLQIITSNIPSYQLAALSYEWKYNSKIISTLETLQTNLPGTYTGTVTRMNCSASKDANVIVHELPISKLPEQYIFCADNGNSISLNAGTENKYYWTQTNETTQSISVFKAGIYEVFLYNTYMCKVKASTIVKEACKPTLFVSSAFSPNGDQINDIYETFDNHIGNYSMTIFNRWGEIVFQSKDKTVFWDGFYKGQLMPVGVYPYLIKYEGDTDTYKGPYSIEGSVTLIK